MHEKLNKNDRWIPKFTPCSNEHNALVDEFPAFTNIPDQHLRMTNITKQQLMDYCSEMYRDTGNDYDFS